MKKIQLQAIKAKNAGYEYIASVIAQCFTTVYYNVQSVDSVIKDGWQAAPKCNHFFKNGSYAVIRIGRSDLPEKTIRRSAIWTL